ncbi:hypothetical protein C4559_02850 [Candidatus Microgenomates bacterium]|nr:MAG: hypothetical protein C4559_02850 [Candidatus Microgenomates bacterium]
MRKKKKLDRIYIPTGDSGEGTVSGDNPNPESDDDTVKNVHDVGIDLEETEDRENPQEMDIADDINKSEKHIKDH